MVWGTTCHFGNFFITGTDRESVCEWFEKFPWWKQKSAYGYASSMVLSTDEDVYDSAVSGLLVYPRMFIFCGGPSVYFPIAGFGRVQTLKGHERKGYATELLEGSGIFLSMDYFGAVLYSKDRTLYSRAGFKKVAKPSREFLWARSFWRGLEFKEDDIWLKRLDPPGHF